MKLDSIQLTNFRCFRSLTIGFDPHLTVFVAENGQGKSTVLDAAAIGLDEIVRYFAGGRANSPGRAILRRTDVSSGESTATVFTSIQGDASYKFEWSDSIEIVSPQKANLSSGKRPDELNAYLDRLSRGESLDDAPLVVFYRASRAFRDLAHPRLFKLQAFDPQHAFQNALDGAAGFEAVQHWFYQIENEELREKDKLKDFAYQDPRLRAVREAVGRMIPEASELGFEAGWDGLSVRWNGSGNLQDNAPQLLLTQLSDGYRTLLAMAMDLASRLVLANPGRPDPLSAGGVVMIDEIDLHLHPRWQQRIISDLRRTFPNIQWILTTHSPQVLSTVKPESIRILRDGEIISPAGKHSYGVQSNRVLNEIMGVAARPEIPELEDKKQKLMARIRENKADDPELRSLLEELTKVLGSEDPFIINSKAELAKRSVAPR